MNAVDITTNEKDICGCSELSHAIESSVECFFFLTLSHSVLFCDNPPQENNTITDPLTNEVVAPWFGNMTEFHAFMERNKKQEFDAETFRKLVVSPGDMKKIQLTGENPKLLALSFFLNFCKSMVMAEVTLVEDMTLNLQKMDFPGKTDMLRIHASIMQVLERFADTQHADKRKSSDECLAFIEDVVKDPIKLQKNGSLSCDFVGKMWKVKDPATSDCIFSFDESARIFRAIVKPGITALSQESKEYLLQMMERDDIAVITGGLYQDFDSSLWNQSSILGMSGEMPHHRFRLFRQGDQENDASVGSYQPFKELMVDLSMQVCDYSDNLSARQLTSPSNARFKCRTSDGNQIEFELDNVVYMLDYDFKKNFPCIMNFVNAFSCSLTFFLEARGVL